MTKKVRIEDADLSDHKVMIQVWEKRVDGPDMLVSEKSLFGPTDLIEATIWKGRYLIIKEV